MPSRATIRSALRTRAQRAVRRAGATSTAETSKLHREISAVIDAQIGRLDWAGQRLDALEERESRRDQLVEDLKTLMRIDALRRWLEHVTLRTQPLVTVITPTHDRVNYLQRSIASVVAQRYAHWEMVVVDDGGSEDSKAVVDACGDSRISWLRTAHAGAAAARNAALSRARGEIVAYLDDDNTMDRDWLFAVVWAFEQRPKVDTLYGAFVIDDMLRVTGLGSGEMPWTFLHPFSREKLLEDNLADMSAIAHRAGIEGAWFDENVRELADWDLLARLTADKEPLVLPAVACYYSTDAPRRLTMGPTHEQDKARITSQVAESLRR